MEVRAERGGTVHVEGQVAWHLVDVGDDTTTGDGRLDERVELLVTTDLQGAGSHASGGRAETTHYLVQGGKAEGGEGHQALSG